MGADFFLDTNILVYAFDADDSSNKTRIARELIRDGLANGKGVISTQVLQEFYVTVTRKIKTPLSQDDAEAAVEGLCRLKVTDVDVPLIRSAIRISHSDRISFWDALICVAARRAGCDTLISEDMDHGKKHAGITIRNPFR